MDPEHCQLLFGTSPMPARRVCLETSFTSLQSPTVEVYQNSSINSSQTGSYYPTKISPIQLSSILYPDMHSRSPSWNNQPMITSPQSWQAPSEIGKSVKNGRLRNSLPQVNHDRRRRGCSLDMQSRVDLIHDDWFGLAPLASPESLSEVSSISSRTSFGNFGTNLTEVISTSYEMRTPTVMRRTPKISGNLSTCADDIKSVRYFQKLGKYSTFLRCPSQNGSSRTDSSGDLSYESAHSKCGASNGGPNGKFAYLQNKMMDLGSGVGFINTSTETDSFASAENMLNEIITPRKFCNSGCPNCTCKYDLVNKKCCENYDHTDCVFEPNDKSFSTSSEVPTSIKSSPESLVKKPQLLETHFDHNFYNEPPVVVPVYNPEIRLFSPQILSPTSPQIDQDVISNFAIDLNLEPENRSIQFKKPMKSSPSVDSGSICKTPSESKTVSFSPQLVNLDPSMIQTDRSLDLKSIMKEAAEPPCESETKKKSWFLLPRRSPKKVVINKRQTGDDEQYFAKNESLPLLSGLNSNAEKTSPSYVRRKKYVYPMNTTTGRGESSV